MLSIFMVTMLLASCSRTIYGKCNGRYHKGAGVSRREYRSHGRCGSAIVKDHGIGKNFNKQKGTH